jgi:hypothetical protein
MAICGVGPFKADLLDPRGFLLQGETNNSSASSISVD